jgi:hypothetical protein
MAIGQSQQHYLDLLGVKAGATMDEIHTAYYLQVEKYSDNPTEDEAEEQIKLQHAYNILRRSYDESETPPTRDRSVERSPKRVLVIVAVLLAVGLSVLVAMNYSELKLRMTEYVPGTVVRLEDAHVPYGTILRYDPAHEFHTGRPTPAYEIELRNGRERVWLSKRVVVKGMVPLEPTVPEKR